MKNKIFVLIVVTIFTFSLQSCNVLNNVPEREVGRQQNQNTNGSRNNESNRKVITNSKRDQDSDRNSKSNLGEEVRTISRSNNVRN